MQELVPLKTSGCSSLIVKAAILRTQTIKGARLKSQKIMAEILRSLRNKEERYNSFKYTAARFMSLIIGAEIFRYKKRQD